MIQLSAPELVAQIRLAAALTRDLLQGTHYHRILRGIAHDIAADETSARLGQEAAAIVLETAFLGRAQS